MVRKKSAGDRTFQLVNGLFMILLMVITVYPLLYVLFASFSDPIQLYSSSGRLLYKPLGFSLAGYKLVLNNPNIALGYRNTIFYVLVGTFINLVLTIIGAFVLSRRHLLLKKFFMVLVIITMYFSGGMIPRFLVIKDLGLLDTVWAMILPNAVSTWNLIIMRTSFLAIPSEIEEASAIDGANDIQMLVKVIIPLSGPVIAVMVLFYGVGHWNEWFDAMIFLRDNTLYPLQLFLREILIENQISADMASVEQIDDFFNKELIKYCTIVVSTAPILCVYPFLQKYFVKGVMVGALKG